MQKKKKKQVVLEPRVSPEHTSSMWIQWQFLQKIEIKVIDP